MDLQAFLNEEAECYADMFDGGLVIRGFISTMLEGYDGKSDWQEFTPQERDEIVMNCHRMIELLRQAEEG
ncbi:hypothetical protein [Roseibium sp. MMSF_3544]|uniref:hypothetical protein n=1 Tax=unclassified Roseibium TaxID=2629323 RepID=UPI00273DABC3|nr:hypothetical protein [Roseibium sp. MMSF_3544]